MNEVLGDLFWFAVSFTVAFVIARWAARRLTEWVIRKFEGPVDLDILETWSRQEVDTYMRSRMHRTRCSCRKYGMTANVANVGDRQDGELFMHTVKQCVPMREYIPGDKARWCACGRRVMFVGCQYGLNWLEDGVTAVRHSVDSCEEIEIDDDDECYDD